MPKALLVDGVLHRMLQYYDHRDGVPYPLGTYKRAHVHQLCRNLDLVLKEDHLTGMGQELLALLDALRDNPGEVLAACRRIRKDAPTPPGGRHGDNGRPVGLPDGDTGTPTPEPA